VNDLFLTERKNSGIKPNATTLKGWSRHLRPALSSHWEDRGWWVAQEYWQGIQQIQVHHQQCKPKAKTLISASRSNSSPAACSINKMPLRISDRTQLRDTIHLLDELAPLRISATYAWPKKGGRPNKSDTLEFLFKRKHKWIRAPVLHEAVQARDGAMMNYLYTNNAGIILIAIDYLVFYHPLSRTMARG